MEKYLINLPIINNNKSSNICPCPGKDKMSIVFSLVPLWTTE